MSGFIEGENRHQSVLFPVSLDDYIGERLAFAASSAAMPDVVELPTTAVNG